MSRLTINLFGKIEICREGSDLHEHLSQKMLELLCFLLTFRTRPHRRDALAELLWGEKAAGQAKKYLRQVLWQLRSYLEQISPSEPDSLILAEDDWVQINPAFDLDMDIARFEDAYTCVEGTRGFNLSTTEMEKLRGAVELYRGDFLEGWYQDWCLFERERLQILCLTMLDKLMGYAEVHQEFEAGMRYGLKVLYFDPARERTHRRIMRLYYFAGNRTAAIRQYERCTAVLADELGVTPTSRTQTLYHSIRADDIPTHSDGRRTTPVKRGPFMATVFDVIIDSLNQLQNSVQEVKEHVRNLEKKL